MVERPHVWGEHVFCTGCGIAMTRAVDQNLRECPAAPNVIAISELMAARFWDRNLFSKMRGFHALP